VKSPDRSDTIDYAAFGRGGMAALRRVSGFKLPVAPTRKRGDSGRSSLGACRRGAPRMLTFLCRLGGDLIATAYKHLIPNEHHMNRHVLRLSEVVISLTKA
jgi:hypothetical protein